MKSTKALLCDRCGAKLPPTEDRTIQCDDCGVTLRVDLLADSSSPHRSSELRARVAPSSPVFVPDAKVAAGKVVRGVLISAAIWTFASALTIADPFDWRLKVHGAPTAATISLGDEAISQSLSGTTEGEHKASVFGRTCRGHVPSRPTLRLRLSEPTQVSLRASGPQDLVLVTRRDNGEVRCDDDSGGGTAALVAGVIPPGDLRVWVGGYDDESHPFTLELRARPMRDATPLGNGLVIARPSVATLDLDATPSGESAPFNVEGDTNANAINSTCRGMITPGPTFELVTRTPRRVVVTTSGHDDLVGAALVGTTWSCNDDGNSTNPRLALDLSPGRHFVWIGRYQASLNATTRLTWTTEGAAQ